MAAKIISNKQTEEERKAIIDALDDDKSGAEGDPDPDEQDLPDDPDNDQGAGDDDKGDQGDDNQDDDQGDDADDDQNQDQDKDKGKPPAKDVDYKKKFAASTAEAQRLAQSNKTYEEKIEEANNLPEPTDEECRTEYGADEWDALDAVTQKIARKSLHSDKKMAFISKINEAVKVSKERLIKINAFSADPETVKQFPTIEGREEEFVKFASKESRQNMDLEDVAILFNSITPKRQKAPNGQLFPRNGSSLDKGKPKPTHLTADQAKVIRQTDQRKYQRMVRDGKIKPGNLVD